MTDALPATLAERRPVRAPGHDDPADGERSSLRREARGGARRTSNALVIAVVAVCLAVGVALRAWLLLHRPINADEAVAGLMANQILHGHFSAFFWGQHFGGVEPYVVAAVFAVFGQSPFTLDLAPVLLSLVSAVLVWRVALRLVRDRRLAALAGALVWTVPFPAVFQSTVEGGYRGVVMVCGIGACLFALRILDGQRRYREFVALGLLAGVGWWALPEIVYFFVPGLVLLGGAARRKPRAGVGWWAPRLGASAGAFSLGALPWLWTNIGSGFASLRSNGFAGSTSPFNHGFGSRLSIFFQSALPLQLDLRRLEDGRWLFGGTASHDLLMVALTVLAVSVVVASLVSCGLRGGRAWAIVAAIVAFPLLDALQPGTWYWQDGRYDVYLGSFLVLGLAIGAEELGGRIERRTPQWSEGPDGSPTSCVNVVGRIGLSLLVVAALLLVGRSFSRSTAIGTLSHAAGWGSPNAPSQATANALSAHGIRFGYADYWVAYKLDFLSHERLALTVTGSNADRWPALSQQVARAKNPAWVFVSSPSALRAAYHQFGPTIEIRGPSAMTQSQFMVALHSLGVGDRERQAGLVTVVAPLGKVAPMEVWKVLSEPR